VGSADHAGSPLGTFYGPVFVGVDATTGFQVFAARRPRRVRQRSDDEPGSRTPRLPDHRQRQPGLHDRFHNQVNWGKFDISFLLRASVGQDVFNNTALVWSTKSNALQVKNFLAPALTTAPICTSRPSFRPAGSSARRSCGSRISRWSMRSTCAADALRRSARLYVSADNLFVITGYSGLDPEVSSLNASDPTDVGLAARGIDYLSYPRPRTITGGLRVAF